MDITRVLPRECICKIISFTTAKDACRSSAVCSAFKESADSDDTWETFLPSDCKERIAQSSSPNLISLPKKQLYLHLSDHPLLLANNTMSFSLEKESGKKVYMIGARGLSVIWGDTPLYWSWPAIRESRFPQVAELNYVWWFEVKGGLKTKLLSPKTTYAVFFIFKFRRRIYKFSNKPVNFSLTEGGLSRSLGEVVFDPSRVGVHQREDGWMEIQVGEFFTEDEDDDGLVEFRVWETDDHYTKKGISVEGFEVRPKNNE